MKSKQKSCIKARAETQIHQIQIHYQLNLQFNSFQHSSIDITQDEVICSSIIDVCCGISNSGCTKQVGV